MSASSAERAALVSLLIPTRALPPLSYAVPGHLVGKVRVGSAVVAPLAGHGRVGIVVGFAEAGGHALKEIRSLEAALSLSESLVEVCIRVAGASAAPLSTVLRAALPPGTRTDDYRVIRPSSGWPWAAGRVVGRTELRRVLGGEALAAAEESGRLALVPAAPPPRLVEWAVWRAGADPGTLGRAPKGRAILEALMEHEGAWPVAELLREAGASRPALLRLVGRGVLGIEKRSAPPPTALSRGSGAEAAPFAKDAGVALEQRGGLWVWRVPTDEFARAASAVARAAAGRGGQALVLVPEAGEVEGLVRRMVELLPAGLAVAGYHGGVSARDRAAVHGAFGRGEVDVVVGTRSAALLPAASLRAVVVVDEPNGSHRPEPGTAGVPLHVRDVAGERARVEGAGAISLSPTPSLRLWEPASGARRLREREQSGASWPKVRVVDMRGTGAAMSPDLLAACRQTLRSGGRIGVVVNRIGRAALLVCARCGYAPSCPRCGLPLTPVGQTGDLRGDPRSGPLCCRRCGRCEEVPDDCPSCGASGRFFGSGLAVEGARTKLREALGTHKVGMLTAGHEEGEESSVVVGSAHYVLAREGWDLVAIPDADTLLFGGGLNPVEAGFRVLYRAAEATSGGGGGRVVVVQTRQPDHYALRAALTGDYEAFARAELPKRGALGYPPHGHLADILLSGGEDGVRRAVESGLTRKNAPGTEVLGPAPVAGEDTWRVLVRGHALESVAGAAGRFGRYLAEGGFRVRITVDPEEA